MASGFALAQESGSGRDRTDSAGTDSSELHDFEKSVQPAPAEHKPDGHHSAWSSERTHERREHDDGFGDDLGASFMQGLVNAGMDLLAAGGASSMQRIQAGADASLYRNDGEPLLPFVRYDFAYQQVSSDISGHINRVEGGYGPVALYLENYSLDETAPPATLDIKRQMFLYRMSVNQIEVDIGLGRSVITGAQRTVMNAVSVRGRFMLGENISIDFLPVWGDGMNDYELAMHYGMQYGSLKVGYRSLNSPTASLSGPFAGVAFYY